MRNKCFQKKPKTPASSLLFYACPRLLVRAVAANEHRQAPCLKAQTQDRASFPRCSESKPLALRCQSTNGGLAGGRGKVQSSNSKSQGKGPVFIPAFPSAFAGASAVAKAMADKTARQAGEKGGKGNIRDSARRRLRRLMAATRSKGGAAYFAAGSGTGSMRTLSNH